MLCNNFEVLLSFFLTVENQTFRHLRKTNVNKRCLF